MTAHPASTGNQVSLSVVTVVRNGAATLANCLESVARLSYPVEHVVVDGGSTDETLEIFERNRSTIATLVSEPDLGMYDAMNKGIGLAGGDVVGFLNADDYFVGEAVSAWIAQAFENPKVDCVYGDLEYVAASDSSHVVRRWCAGPYSKASLYQGWMPPHPTFYARRRYFARYGGFNLDLGTVADYELMLRFLLKYDLSPAYLPQVLVRMRTGGASNRSLKARLLANRMDRKAWRVNGLRPRPWTLTMKPLRKLGQFFQ